MTHLETYLDCLKILPNEFQREFVLMGELDRKAHLVHQEIIQMEQTILEAATKQENAPVNATAPTPTPTTKNGSKGGGEPTVEERLAHLRQLQQVSVDLHNEKLALAKQSKDMILAYASRLDDDMELFKAEFPEALRPEEPTENSLPMKKSHGGGGGGGGARGTAKENRGRGGHKRQVQDDDESEVEDEDESMEEQEEEEEEEDDYEDGSTKNKKKNSGDSGDGADTEVYCVCQQPSFGDMVGCDNKSCPYEWFHFSCVGLKKQPKGTWICDECKINLKM